MRTLRLGAGAGYAGDRIEPAVELATHGQIDYLVFECLAERTVALAQQAKLADPQAGFDPLLDARMKAVLPICHRNRIRIVTNMGAANPVAAAERTRALARRLGLSGLKVAAVTGDDVLDVIKSRDWPIEEDGGSVRELGNRIVSANAYLGAEGMVDALAQGADVVITGRVGDPALYLAPLIHEFGWSMDDWDSLGRGTLAGHLLECAGQITGGYFADPGFKDVPRLGHLGFPIGIVDAAGGLEITKVPQSGGAVTLATCKEQLLYEVHDPARYFQPDVVADFSQVTLQQVGPDRVRAEGARGAPATGLLKVSVGVIDSYVGEGQLSYAGPGAVERGRLALDIVRERIALTGIEVEELRCDLIGIDSLHGPDQSASGAEPYEVRLRVAGRTQSLAEAERLANEVETLYTNGPAGGGGAWKNFRTVLGVVSVLVPSELARPKVTVLEA